MRLASLAQRTEQNFASALLAREGLIEGGDFLPGHGRNVLWPVTGFAQQRLSLFGRLQVNVQPQSRRVAHDDGQPG